MRKLVCKPKDQVATEGENNIVYETDCSNCEAVYFGKSKRSVNRVSMNPRDLPQIAIVNVMNIQNTVGKQITTLAWIRRKLLIGKAG